MPIHKYLLSLKILFLGSTLRCPVVWIFALCPLNSTWVLGALLNFPFEYGFKKIPWGLGGIGHWTQNKITEARCKCLCSAILGIWTQLSLTTSTFHALLQPMQILYSRNFNPVPNCKMYLSKLHNVFVQIVKCICLKYKMCDPSPNALNIPCCFVWERLWCRNILWLCLQLYLHSPNNLCIPKQLFFLFPSNYICIAKQLYL